jgi:hypothetical protein
MSEEERAPDDLVYPTDNIEVLGVPETFYGLLEAIRHRPGTYLGRKSLRDFYAWLGGCRFGRMQCGLPPLQDEVEFEQFDFFVCEKYRWHDTGGWAAKIAYYHRDDAEALDEFFRLLGEFRAGYRPKPESARGDGHSDGGA